MLGAMAAQARGAVELAEGDARAALVALRHARGGVAGARGAVRGGTRARADRAGLPRARATRTRPRSSWTRPAASSQQLGAAPDLARVDALTRRRASGDAHGLTPRELQVLRLVAAGRDQQGHRRRAGAQRADGGPAREQHLHQAPRVLAGRGDGVRVRAPARLRAAGWNYPRRRARGSWVVPPMRRPSPLLPVERPSRT